MDRSRVTRFAAPAAFLAAITIGAVVVRAGFEHGKHHAKTPTTTLTTTTKAHKHKHAHRRHHVQTYTVQSGDTLESIATKIQTTVARLRQLNPGVSPTALRVGEKIRVK